MGARARAGQYSCARLYVGEVYVRTAVHLLMLGQVRWLRLLLAGPLLLGPPPRHHDGGGAGAAAQYAPAPPGFQPRGAAASSAATLAAAGHGEGRAPQGDATGVATVEDMDFGRVMTETTAAKMATLSTRPNAHFLRRGTRSAAAALPATNLPCIPAPVERHTGLTRAYVALCL